jgi:hypothetical protein
MRKPLWVLTAVLMLVAGSARAEFQQIDLSIFGMD